MPSAEDQIFFAFLSLEIKTLLYVELGFVFSFNTVINKIIRFILPTSMFFNYILGLVFKAAQLSNFPNFFSGKFSSPNKIYYCVRVGRPEVQPHCSSSNFVKLNISKMTELRNPFSDKNSLRILVDALLYRIVNSNCIYSSGS